MLPGRAHAARSNSSHPRREGAVVERDGSESERLTNGARGVYRHTQRSMRVMRHPW